ncbi:MAG: transporter, partial [Bacteroidota bacterium]
MTSHIELYDLESGKRTVILSTERHLEAPNWSRDGAFLVVNGDGKLYRLPIEGGELTEIPTDFATTCNNDHGLSPDGTQLVISHHDNTTPEAESQDGDSRIYLLPAEGGTPKVVTDLVPSYWHGWSPDGQTLAYVGARNGEYDIYSISVEGGEETRLTSAPGLDDGPDYSPDGNWIYYNSMASGKMEIWRMRSDGSEAEQLTDDAYSNWFPHPSPTGEGFVYIAYLQDQGDRHPPMKDVALRYFDEKKQEIRTLCEFTGGQGTINVPSWSP